MKSFSILLLFCAGLSIGLSAIAQDQDPERLEADIAARLARIQNLEQVSDEQKLWVQSLLNYAEQQHIPHPERASLRLPRYQIRARARSLWQSWQTQQLLKQWQLSPAKRFQTVNDRLNSRVRALWLQQASPQELAEFRQLQPATGLDEAAWQVLVQRQQQLSDWQQLLRIGRSRQTLHMLQEAGKRHSSEEYAGLLQLALDNPHMADHAAVLLGRLAREQAVVADALRQELRASPLLRLTLESALEAELDGLDDLLAQQLYQPDSAALAAYGLWRSGSSRAHQTLRDYRDSERALSHLREEITLWLD